MTEPSKPLTADDVAMLKRVYAKHDDIQRLIATIEQIEKLMSGDIRREIENAAYKRVACAIENLYPSEWQIVNSIRSLIQPPAQREDGK